MIAEAWLTVGYSLHNLNLQKGKITLHWNKSSVSKLVIPDVLLSDNLSYNAVYELETHIDYVIKKYGSGEKKYDIA